MTTSLLFTTAFLASGCSSHGGGASGPATSVAPTTSAPAPAPALLAAPDVVPVICVHGITAEAEVWAPFTALYGTGRYVVPSLYAQEADQLKPGDLPLSSVVSAGYYRESASSPKYGNGDASIGGAPVPRTDSFAANYKFSYTERLGRIVDGVRRATGSDRVDLVCHSMGNIVARAYIHWHSDGAQGGKSKVRRYLAIAGPHRGVNAVEAYSLGFSRGPAEEFMRMGEVAEMCAEYPAWSGRSFVDLLNDDWDGFCQRKDVSYGGASATGAHGKQVDPNGSGTVLTIATVVVNVVGAFVNLSSIANLKPFADIFLPWKLVPESIDALGPGDGVVRLAISRLDQAPFLRTEFWTPFEGRHQGNWNTEQAIHGSTFTAELARQFVAEGTVPGAASVTTCSLSVVDAPGKASWIAVETEATGVTSAQLVEELLDANGNPVGGATGFGCPVHDGTQRAFFRVAAGGGERRYHLVLYGAHGPALTQDATFTLTNGALEDGPTTAFVNATTTARGAGAEVHATFASNAQDPTLAFSYRLDGGAWTPFAASATFDTPALGPGEHRLEARARHAANGARLLADDARGTAVGLFVDASGGVIVRH